MRVPAIAAIAFLVAFAAPWATQVKGQESSSPAFEVASLKPSNPDPTNPLSALPMILPSPGGRLTASNIPFKMLVLSVSTLVMLLSQVTGKTPTPD